MFLICVPQAEEKITQAKLDKEYIPIGGTEAFTNASAKLALGDDSLVVKNKRVGNCFAVLHNT